MKRVLLPLIGLLTASAVSAQADYSGAYGYSFKPQGDPPKTEKSRGRTGNLVLLKMEGNKYRFWLDLSLGWPSYNVGETDGTIAIVNDTASFDNTFENAINACILKFNVSGEVITILSVSSSFNCGFGNGVHADGEYTRLKPQPVFNNAWLKKEYAQSPFVVVTANKTELFQDERCEHSFSPKKYFLKGDSLLHIADGEKTIYTEQIPLPGKFTYGWIRKQDLKMEGTQ